MIMDALKGAREGTSPHTSPAKRTFDVAFLTGARDHALDARLASDVASPPKVSRVAEHKALSPPARASSSPAPSSPPREDAAPGSAFTKVTRSQGSPPPPPPPFSAASTLDALSSAWPPVSASFSAVSSLLGSTKSLAPLLAAPGLLPPGLAPFLPPAAAPDRLNNNLVEEYLKSQHQLLDAKASGADLSAGEALSRLRSSMYPADPYKLPFSSLSYPLSAPPHAEAAKLSSAAAAAAAAPFVPQPSVSAMMPPSLTSLALSTQNVCAKCNISFRMTSDLVYHMRSQHKREPDPYKKRRNEKLKCSYCGESFRERHHLTRHMSAHQDRDEEAEAK